MYKNIRCVKTKIELLTKDDTVRASNLERLKEIERELPEYLRMRKKTDVGNTEELKISALGNSYRGHLSSTSPKQANNVGRGLTAPIFHIDEGPFIPNIEIALPAALAAGSAARDLAREIGAPYGTLFTTTAGKKDDRDGRYIYKLVQESAVWNEKFYDAKNQRDLETIIRSCSHSELEGGLVQVNLSLNHRQLGKDDAWLKKTLAETKSTGEDADRDFFNRWTAGSQKSPFTIETSEKIRDSEREVVHMGISETYRYVTRWYVPERDIANEMERDFHIISVDSSDAVGRDDIAVTIRNIRTGAVTGAATVNEINLIRFSEWLFQMFVSYEKLVGIIERRSSGPAIMDYLIMKMVAAGMDPFKKLYNKVVQEAGEHPDRFNDINRQMYARDRDVYEKYRKYFGYATSSTGDESRDNLYGNTLQKAVATTGDCIHDTVLVNQLLSLEIRNNRVDHPIGGHDDSVVSWLLSYWFITMGRNLNFYGIDSRDILSDPKFQATTDQVIDQYEVYIQKQLRTQIQELGEKLKKEKDEFINRKYENQLKALSRDLVLQPNENFSVDGFINKLREERHLERTMQRGNYNMNRYDKDSPYNAFASRYGR
jgi:hypothetical protein